MSIPARRLDKIIEGSFNVAGEPCEQLYYGVTVEAKLSRVEE